MAGSLIEMLTDDFDPTQFVDTYRERLEEAARAKIEGQVIAVTPAGEPTQVMDLMEALKGQRGGHQGQAGRTTDPKSA